MTSAVQVDLIGQLYACQELLSPTGSTTTPGGSLPSSTSSPPSARRALDFGSPNSSAELPTKVARMATLPSFSFGAPGEENAAPLEEQEEAPPVEAGACRMCQ